MRNDKTSDDKKYLGITFRSIRIPDDQYVNYFGQRILARDVPAHHQNKPNCVVCIIIILHMTGQKRRKTSYIFD